MSTQTQHAESKLTGKVLATWRDRMGYKPEDAATAMGITRGQWMAWETEDPQNMPIPLYVGLAMSALALGMPPFGADEDGEGQ